MPIHAQKASRYYQGRQFLRSCGFETIVVTKLLCVKLVVPINLWQSAPPEKSYCRKRPVYDVGGLRAWYTRSGVTLNFGPPCRRNMQAPYLARSSAKFIGPPNVAQK